MRWTLRDLTLATDCTMLVLYVAHEVLAAQAAEETDQPETV